MSATLWPAHDGPADLEAIEAIPLEDRGLPATTYDLLRRAADRWPDRVALSVLPDAQRWDDPAQRTFNGLLADVHQAANLLHGLGIRGGAVALLSPNCAELITMTLAAELAGMAAPINSSLSVDHIGALLTRSGARVLVAAGPELAPEVWKTACQVAADRNLTALLALRPSAGESVSVPLPAIKGVHVGYLADLTEAQPRTAFKGDLPSASDVAALFHTGGTTGTPKLAAHTHANEVADAWMIALGFPDDLVTFAALPLFHVNALVVTVLAPLFKGQHVVWAGPLGYRDLPLYKHFWELVQRHRIGAMSAVPTVYAALAGCPVDADISSLHFPMVGASPLPESVRQSFESVTGVQLIQGYGLTEATCASVRSLPGHHRTGSVGQRLPYQQVKVVKIGSNGTWTDLPTGRVGVLAIKGPTVFPGYVVERGPDGLVLDGLGKLREGWLDTGDLARVDQDGFVYLTGRAKDVIIRGGHNIDPAVVEEALLAHPDVTGAQAVGRPDAHAGEVPVAFVTLAPGAAVTADELRAWAVERVPEQAAAPKSVTVLDELPVTSVGKPYKPALRAEATRAAVAEALSGLAAVTAVRAHVEDGYVVAVVALSDAAEESGVKEALARFAVAWRMEVVQ